MTHFFLEQSNPYFMMKESDELLTGNDRFEGFVFDIIDEISKMLGFNYTFQIVEDGNYGSLNKETGEWNGMIRELLDGVSRKFLLINEVTIQNDVSLMFTRKRIWLWVTCPSVLTVKKP
jgi:ionotropic glutamate receptor